MQNWVRKANLSLLVSTDRKGQRKGPKVSFPGRSGDVPDTCTDELHAVWCPQQCSATLRKNTEL